LSHGGNACRRHGHANVADAGDNRHAQIGPHRPEQGRKAIGIKQFVTATDQERGRLRAAAEAGEIISRRAEIDRKPE
jgi:hypothetical protein